MVEHHPVTGATAGFDGGDVAAGELPRVGVAGLPDGVPAGT